MLSKRLICLFALLVVATVIYGAANCPEGEQFYTCSLEKCYKTCQDAKTPPPCPAIAPGCNMPSCECKGDLLRSDQGTCVSYEECSPPRCPKNEHYEYNSSKCQLTCSNMQYEYVMAACYPTIVCYCNKGYVRDENGLCIKRENCPIPPIVCGPNEVSTDCYNNCQRTCKNRFRGDGRVCDTACTRTGCVCKPGYLRHDNGTCVEEYNCSPADCNVGEVYSNCGSSCPKSCENKDNTCLVCLAVCEAGCFCAPGTIRGPGETCIRPENCPLPTCGPNQIFDKCPPTCPRTEQCKNLWTKEPCTEIDCCHPQCRCKPGFYRDNYNNCISAQQCIAGNQTTATATAEATATAY